MKLSKKPNIIVLDLSSCKTWYDIHETIRETFDFPEWYGKNWSAFEDLISEPREYTIVQIRGYNSLPEDIAHYCHTMIDILERNKKYYADFMKRQDKWDRRFDYIIID